MLRTRRLLLRRFRDDDLDPFAAVLADPDTMEAWGGRYTHERARAELAAKLGFIAGELGTYYWQRLALQRVTAELHTRSASRRTPPG